MAAIEGGQPIPVGTGDRRGPLSAGLSADPAGAAHVYGPKQWDLFVVAGKFSSPPGLFLYRWRDTAPGGQPVFGERVPVRQPSSNPSPLATIWQDSGAIHGLFVDGKDLIHALYEDARREFRETARIGLEDLPRPPSAIALLDSPGGAIDLILHIPDGTREAPPGAGWRDPGYVPYDGRGIWRGGLPYLGLYAVSRPDLGAGPLGHPRLVSPSARDVLWGNRAITVVDLGPGHQRGLVSGSRFGDLYYYPNRAASGVELTARLHIAGRDGNALRHPIINASPVAYPNPVTGFSDLIAGGEGALYYYRFTGRFLAPGNPVYEAPVPVLEEKAMLYSGSLGVPTQVDWDGDGAVDIVCGNSEGRILFFRNAGTNAQPSFDSGTPIEAGGRPIHIQPGYRGDIQGPGEARWGYVSPNVVDWNGDGLPDILLGDSLGRHVIYINHGTRRRPKLAPESPLYLDGLDLHGTWRVRPGVGLLDGRMVYIANDDDDEFHLYRRLDDYNLRDGGKLRMEDGSAIRANFLGAGGTGRSKIELVDWDGDGRMDLLVGTPRHHSVPNPETGLPRALGLPGSTVLFLKNTGTNTHPRFRFPQALTWDGKPIYFGQHEIGASAGPLGGGAGPNLVVSREDGRLFYFGRDRMGFRP